jgi:hypothetical protein
MANKEEELKNKIARIRETQEAEVPRLADLTGAVVGALEKNDASAHETAGVGFNAMLDAFGHMFGETNAEILANVINQVVAQLSDHPLVEELVEHIQGLQKTN